RLELTGPIRGAAITAPAVALLGQLAFTLLGILPFVLSVSPELHTTFGKFGIGAPLVFALIAVLVLIMPAQRTAPDGSAALAPRTWLSFVRRRWTLPLGLALLFIVLSTVLAGRASAPDDDGNHTMYWVDAGALQVGTGIYGWYYSIPHLAIIALLLAVTAFGLRWISRPPLSADSERDAAARRQRSLVLIALVTGALLLHLGGIWHDLAGTAGVRGHGSTEDGDLRTWSDFAALEQPLRIAARIVNIAGYTTWVTTLLLLALPRKRSTR
uniref:hypothetical protein n=1 Tax=uncultured Agrococcus sp. TaxID=382258 RepID=UPI0025D6AC7F